MSPKLSLIVAIFSMACGSSQSTTVTGGDDLEPATAQRGTATAAEGARLLELACQDGAEERCDALDDDCDGLIDEGCGYGAGVLSIVATWGDQSDLDLVVTSQAAADLPTPETHSGRGGCQTDDAHPRIESASWAEPLRGELRISLTHVDSCGEQAEESAEEGVAPATTTGSVSIALGGETIGAFNVDLEPGATVEVATLSLTN